MEREREDVIESLGEIRGQRPHGRTALPTSDSLAGDGAGAIIPLSL